MNMGNRHIGKWALIVSIIVIVIVAYAWIDGGEQPTRTIEQSVALEPASGD